MHYFVCFQTLEQHYHHSVALLAQKRRFPIGTEEEDFSSVVQQAADPNSVSISIVCCDVSNVVTGATDFYILQFDL